MGFETVAIARGKDKEPLARELGARVYIDSQAQDPAAELPEAGRREASILATVTSGEAMAAVIGGLGARRQAPRRRRARRTRCRSRAGLLIGGRRSIAGWPSGDVDRIARTRMAFAALTGVRSMNELFPLDRAAEAYDRMMSGKARFRVVLTTNA